MSRTSADVLASVLERTGLRGQVFCRSVGRAPWALRFPEGTGALFHVVLSGTCSLARGKERLQLAAGDVILLPRGGDHRLADPPRTPAVDLAAWLASSGDAAERSLGSASGPETEVLCGVFHLGDAGAGHPVLDRLPDCLLVRSTGGRAASDLAGTIASLRGETERGDRGSTLVVARLLEILFVQIVRAWIEREGAQAAGWIGALEDPVLATAIAALHEEPARAWDVEALAAHAGTSRATLARKFVAQVGEPPLAYLTRVRLDEAARLLATTPAPLAEIAALVGYGTEFALSRAFRRRYGRAPGRFRSDVGGPSAGANAIV